ncbi:MAG TPA: L-lactate permease [Vicinamibacterales bacterium]|jgi:glycolate permease/lactate permease
MTEVFHQAYSPVADSVLLSALVASLPPLLLAVLLAWLRVVPWKSAIAAAAAAFGLAWLVWGMPFTLTLAAATHGMAYGLWPISWIVICSVFFYNLTVESGDFDVIRRSLSRLTSDRRIQLLLVAFCFGALIEGIAGFGAPVAITASMLAGLGFEPIMAAALSLIANTAPVAFGSLGIPVTTLGGLLAPMLGHDVQSTTHALSQMAGRQLPFFSLFIPAYLVVIYAGWRRMLEVWPAVIVAGATFAIGQFTVSNFVGPELTDVLAALFSLTSVALLLQVWQPAQEFKESAQHVTVFAAAPRDTPARVFRAYATYLILIATVLVGQIGNLAGMSKLKPPANVTALFKCGQVGNALCPEPWIGESAAVNPQALRFPVWEFSWPGAYTMQNGKPSAIVRREVPVVAASTPYPLTYRLDFLAAAGTLVVIAALIAFIPMLIVGVPPKAFFTTALKTGRQLKLPVVTIAFILSISTVMNYSGMTSSMALALAKTGKLFPFFAAWLGMIGVFLTGSDTSSNTLFGPLQATTAKLSGLDPILMSATNGSAGVMGKMISPQNLSVGAAGVGAVGREGEILARVVFHSLLFTFLVGVLAMLQAYVLTWMVPVL